MRFELRCDRRDIRVWHVALLERVSLRPGVVATVSPGDCISARQPIGRALLRLDRALYQAIPKLTAPARAASLARFERQGGASPDIVLDLCDPVLRDGSTGNSRVWRLTFDNVDNQGSGGHDALLQALLNGAPPIARICEGCHVIAVARLGTEASGGLLQAMEDYLSRTIGLVDAALTGTARAITAFADARPEPTAATPSAMTVPRAGRTAARQIAGAAIRHVYRFVYDSPHWRVGWRRLDGPDVLDLRRHPNTGWRTLPDDGHRFYADPFPIEHEGTLTVFLEDFQHRTRKGVISAVRFDADGPIGRPEQVLELPYHLSYPFVFARDGNVWMIPESCSAERVDLFRATSYPGGWVKEATLVAGVVASDATLLQAEGRWWMFATVRTGGGAFSDALHLWSADDFRGPWTPHRANPVLIDIAAARPAGRMVVRNGVLLRPVQDCRRGYGRALAIARVTKLDDEGFEQIVETTLTAGPLWPGNRLHTLNATEKFEFIDGASRVRRRFWGA